MQIREILAGDRELIESYSRSKVQNAYLGNGVSLARVLGRYSMYVSTRDSSIVPHLLFEGFWEPWITKALNLIEPGLPCIDVGANHGYYSLLLAELSGSEVYAFEPQAELARLVRLSANVNGFRNKVHVLQEAVGDKFGQVRICLPEGDEELLGSAYCTEQDVFPGSLGWVPLTTLDAAVPGQVGFIKIDAEGFEDKIWAGMKAHLEYRPTILMEFSPALYPDAPGFLTEIESCYTLREVDTTGDIVPVSRQTILERKDFSMLWLEN